MRRRIFYYAFMLGILLVSPPPKIISAPFVDVDSPLSIPLIAEQRSLFTLHGLDPSAQRMTSMTSAAGRASVRSGDAIPFQSDRIVVTGPQEARQRPRPPMTVRSGTVPAARPPAVFRYRVQRGDTLFALARRYGTSVSAIVAANGLPSAHRLRDGQLLAIPGRRGTGSAAAPAARPRATFRHRVAEGDTLFDLARRYGTSVNAIVAANSLPSAHRLRVGQMLVLPGSGAHEARPAVRSGSTEGVRTSRDTPSIRSVLGWPARGVLTSRFGRRWRRHHDGIDLAASRGTPIHAALAGRVAFAGWYYGYGRAVIIDHGGGMTTLYGHASTLLVVAGQIVQRGALIARVGCTGACTGSHVHFEVRVNGTAVNPLRYLQ